MLVELGVVEQRYRAVLEVMEDGVPVTEVARWYGGGAADARMNGCAGMRAGASWDALADRSSRPGSCPHQMSVVTEGSERGAAPGASGMGPSRIRWQLEREGVVPLPAVYRALIRHGLVEARNPITTMNPRWC